ncbi:MAG: ABC transporter substrate-binding protein [Bacillota bacterium]
MNRKLAILLALLLIAGLMVAACGGDEAAPPDEAEADEPGEEASEEEEEEEEAEETRGGNVVFSHQQKHETVDANVWTGTNTARIMRQIYDPLVWQPEPGEFVPGLAEEWEISEDGKEFTFYLRDDVVFHDGTPFNAEAVKFTFDRIVDPDSRSLQVPRIGPYEKTEVIDEYTVKVFFTDPFPPFLSNLSEVALAPCSPTAVGEKERDEYAHYPVAAGPFKVKDWPDDNTIVLERFEEYNWAPEFMNHQGPAYLETITYKMIEENTTRLVSLESGDANMLDAPPADEIERLVSGDDYEVITIQTPGMPLIFQPNVTRMPTSELEVRRAILYAVNRQQVADLLSFGVDKPGNGPISSATWTYDPDIEDMYPHDPEKANEILDEAGWEMNEETGVREKDGEPLRIRFVASVGLNTQAGEIVQAMLDEVGIEFVVEGMAYEATVVRMADNDYEMGRLGYTLLDPHDAFYLAYHSSQIEGGGQFNRSRVSDPQLDEWIEEGSQEVDTERRAEIYRELQHYIMDQAYILPIKESSLTHVMDANVKGFAADSLGRPWLYNVWVE